MIKLIKHKNLISWSWSDIVLNLSFLLLFFSWLYSQNNNKDSAWLLFAMIGALVGAVSFHFLIFISLISKIKKVYYNNRNSVGYKLSLGLLLLIIFTFGIGALVVALITNKKEAVSLQVNY